MSNVQPLKVLTAYREQEKLTPQGLADLLGVSRVCVSRWETGMRKPDRKLLPKISKITKIPVNELRPDIAEMFAGAAE